MTTDIVLRGNSSGSGAITIQVPSSSGTRTLTVPDEAAGLITGNSTLSANNIVGTLDPATAPTGSIIQVISNSSNSYTQQGGFGESDVAPSVTITPQFSSSKFWITHTAGAMGEDTSSVGFALKRNGSRIWTATRYGYSNDGNWSPIAWSASYIDSPNTTGTLTYNFAIHSEGGDLRHNDDDGGVPGFGGREGAITTVMEIR